MDRFKDRNSTRKILWQWGNTINRIKRLEREQQAYMDMVDDARITLRAQALTGMPRGGQRTDLSDVVCRIEKREEQYKLQVELIQQEIDSAIKLRNAVEDAVATLSPIQERVINMRYAEGKQWQLIAAILYRDESGVRAIEAQSVDAISAVLAKSSVF